MTFGTVIKSSDVATALRDEDYWKKQYSALDKASLDVMSSLKSSIGTSTFDFSKSDAISKRILSQNILDTYSEGADQKSAIMSSNLGQGYKKDLLNDLDSTLDRAYESYLLNYQQDKLSAERSLKDTIASYEKDAASAQDYIQSMRDKLDKDLLEESDYASEFYHSVPEYLDWIYEQEFEGDPLSLGKWSEYFVGKDGKYLGSKEIFGKMYDEEGNLNKYGLDVFNMLLANPLARQDENLRGYSYEEYLEKEGRDDLGKWLFSTSNYSTDEETFDNYTYLLRQYGIDPSSYKYISDIKDAETPEDMVGAYNDGITTGAIQGTPVQLTGELDADGHKLINRYSSSYFGDLTVTPADVGKQQIISFDSASLGVDGKVNNNRGDIFSLNYTDSSGKKHNYRLMTSKTAIGAGDEVYDYVNRKVGGIKANKIYAYGNELYAGVQDKNGDITLRLLKDGKVFGNDYKEIIDLISDKNNWGRQYLASYLGKGKLTDPSKTKEQQIADSNKAWARKISGYTIAGS